MKINKEIVEKLNPCKSRFDNFVQKYPDFDGDLEDFVLLENITYSDKVWVFVRLATKEQNVKWSLLCASSVLSIFESKYPYDDRPRKALEAVENYLKNPDAARAAYAAAADAAAAAAYAAADAADAAAAAAYAANAAAANARAAARAAYAAYAAAANARAAARAAAQEQTNLLFMVEALR